jgi:hypothetical protein
MVQLPAGAQRSLYQHKVLKKFTYCFMFERKDNVESVLIVAGFSFNGNG